MKVSIFFPCFNESRILRQTIAHYRMCFSNPSFTIFDNYSTDNSVEIAKELGCNVIYWSSNGSMCEHKLLTIRNTCWKKEKGWVIVCDADEWLHITEESLQEEEKNGATLLRIKGYDMVGESNSETLDDIDLHSITKCVEFAKMNKNICFDTRHIDKMNFAFGSHSCIPEGSVQYSKKTYALKHMDLLGLPYTLFKNKGRYERNDEMRKQNLNNHYLEGIQEIEKNYTHKLQGSKSLNELFFNRTCITTMTPTEIKNKNTSKEGITIYIFCLHDFSITRQTLLYYRNLFPKSTLFLCVEKRNKENSFFIDFYNYTVLEFPNIHDKEELVQIKNHYWKSLTNGWVITVDDDQWLMIDQRDLVHEELCGKTVISNIEYKMVGNEKMDTMNTVTTYIHEPFESKTVCFYRGPIFEINYTLNGTLNNPVGLIQYSEKQYPLKKFLLDTTHKPLKNDPIVVSSIKKYKILVFMADSRELMNNFDISPHNSLVAAINYAYCLRHGYDFKYVHTFYKHMNNKMKDNCVDPFTKQFRHASWGKLLAASSCLTESYDYIVYIDSDCIFHNHFFLIESLIDANKDKDFIFLNNKPWNSDKPSSGFFICRTSEFSKQFLKQWYEFDTCSINQESLLRNRDQSVLWEHMDMGRMAILDIPMFFYKSDNQYLIHIYNDKERIPYFKNIVLLKNINYTYFINNIFSYHYSLLDTSLCYDV